MTAKQKISELHDKYYKNAKPTKAVKTAAKVEKAIQAKSTIQKVNKKLAKAGIEVAFVGSSSAPQASGDTIKPEVGIVDQAKTPKEGTRAQLMAEAQKKGIKYFRILSKDELDFVLHRAATEADITKTTEEARKRWQAGWKKNKAPVTEPVAA